MKRKIVSVLTALMVLSMSTTVFAASSPTTDQVTESVIEDIRNEVSSEVAETVGISSQAAIVVTSADVAGAEMTASTRAQITNTVNRVLEVVRTGAIALQSNERTNVAAVFNLSAGNFQPDENGNYNIAVTVRSLEAGKTVYVLHINNAGEVVETIPVTVGENGQVNFSVTGFSTFAIVEKVQTAAVELPYSPEYYEELKAQYTAGEAAAAKTTASATTSPKTAAPAAMSLVAAICLAGAGVCTKKAR